MILIPLLSLCFLNYKIHKAIKTREQFKATVTVSRANANNKERDVTIGQILLAIVIMFFVCHIFKVVTFLRFITLQQRS